MKKSLRISSIAVAVAITVALVTSVSGAKNAVRSTGSKAQKQGSMGADIGQGVPGVTLTPEQKDRVADIREETRSRVQNIRNDSNLTREEQERLITRAQDAGHDRVLAALTLQQRRQLDERWQVHCRSGKSGKDSMHCTDPKMQGQGSRGADIGQGVPGVTLTSAQKDRIADIREETRSRIQSIRKDDNLTREEQERLITRAQDAGHDRVLAALTLQQRRQLDERWQAHLTTVQTQTRK